MPLPTLLLFSTGVGPWRFYSLRHLRDVPIVAANSLPLLLTSGLL